MSSCNCCGLDDQSASGWWWLSYADSTLPVGSQFLGVTILYAGERSSFLTAVHLASEAGLNPGGEVIGFPSREPPEGVAARLLQRPELERRFGPLTQGTLEDINAKIAELHNADV